MGKKNRMVVSLLLACLMCLCMCSIAGAHAAVAEAVSGTTQVKFMFSDGSSAKGARIIVYDANQEQIGKGKVDKEGIFDYAEYVGTASELYMNDGEGHSVTYKIPADAEEAATEAVTEAQTEEEEDGMTAGRIAAYLIAAAAIVAVALLVIKRKKK